LRRCSSPLHRRIAVGQSGNAQLLAILAPWPLGTKQGAIRHMRTCCRRWTAILLLVLLPVPTLVMALAPMSHHACCDRQPASSMVSNDSNACSEPSAEYAGGHSCSSDSNESCPASHGSGDCSQCSGLAGSSFALPQRHGSLAALTAGFVATPARPSYLPAPPPSRLERPPRVFSS
jgi:hypothetical protein